jgi:GntR family transcriptional repressor for pyruvate dehydrogenase complex
VRVNDRMSASFHAVHRDRASHKVVAQIRGLLTSGRIRPGDRLPAERRLAETLQVGRSTVREAYRALEALGLIQVQPGTATRVAQPSLVTKLVPVNDAWPCGAWNRERQLLEVRLMLEPPVAALAARRATSEHLAKLRAVLETQERDLDDGRREAEADTHFHALLFDASGNPLLGDIADRVTALLGERWKKVAFSNRKTLSLSQHRRIFHAVRARNPKAAERHMRVHLRSIGELVLDVSR